MHLHVVLLTLCYFLFTLPCVVSQAEPTPLTSPCPVVLPTNSRIVGGSLIESPYMVSFLTTSGECSGTLITPTVIITAEHCDIDTFTTAFVSSTDGSDGTTIPISSVVKHPDADIMLVTLASAADVEPAKILANPDLPSAWSFLRSQGYGIQSGLPFPSDRRLRFVDFPFIPADVCEEISQSVITPEGVPLADVPTFPNDFVCTGYLQSASCTFCSGDSGGGVFSLLDNDPVLVGVISVGNALCALPGTAGYSVRVSSYIDWLDEQGVQYDAVTELSETFVDSGGVTGGGSDGRPRVPNVVVETVQTGLAPGAIAGIAVGAVAAVAIAVLAALFFVRRSKRSSGDAPADGGENVVAPSATGSSIVPPSQHIQPHQPGHPGQPGQVQGPSNLPPPAPMYATVSGKFVELAQPGQQSPQVAQPLAQPPLPVQTAPQPSQLPAQQTTSVTYPTQTPPPVQQATPAVQPMSSAPPPPPQAPLAVDPTPATQPPPQPPQ